jgi:transcription termination factor Rho
MPVLDRSALVDSPLADLHAIASELSIDGFRRLRRPELIDAILIKQGNDDAAPVAEDGDAQTATEEETPSRSRRGRRGGRGRSSARKEDDAETETETETPAEAVTEADDGEEEAAPKPRRSRSRSRVTKEEEPEATAAEEAPEKPARSRSRSRAAKEEKPETAAAGAGDDTQSDAADGTPAGEETVDGVVELLANGSGFVRVAGPDPSDDDVYISSAQVKRCELVSGDTITGPKRAPRRSERFASLIRVETINGRPASELADSVRFDDLPAALPSVRLKVGSEDPTLKAIEWLTPFGRGSRVTITGASRAGKTEALKRLAAAFVGSEDLTVSVALVGVRPEEISEWTSATEGVPAPAAALSFAASEDVQSGAVEPVVDQARRLAARGAHAVVLIDTLDGLSSQAARRVMASARNLVDGGSVTVIATATEPVGGETTVIALDVSLTSVGRFPALDLVASGTLRPELLVGEAGAEAIARTRAEVSEDDED